MCQGVPPSRAAHGTHRDVAAVNAAVSAPSTALTTTTTTTTSAHCVYVVCTTAAPVDNSRSFPKWAIGVIVAFVLLVVLFALSYHFNLLCFQLLRRLRRRRRAHQSHYGNRTEIPLPSAEVPAAMSHGLHPDVAQQQLDSSPYADAAADVMIYKRTPLNEGGGHHWIPSFSRMYDRMHPEQSRGLFIVLRGIHGEVLLHHSTQTSKSSSSDDERESSEGYEDSVAFVMDASRNDGTTPPSWPSPLRQRRRRHHGRVTLPPSIPQAESASLTEASSAAAPSATWMTAGTPLRSYITSHLTDPLYQSVLHPYRTRAAGTAATAATTVTAAVFADASGGGGGDGGDAAPAADGIPAQHQRRATGPLPAEGVATVPNGYRAPTHMFFPLAQYCDLRQWYLVDRPEASLGAVQVCNPFTLAATPAAAPARRRGDTDSNDTESAEYDVPSDILYGCAQYKKKLVSPAPESRLVARVASADSTSSVPHVRGNRFCANVSDDSSAFESGTE